jgi:hypothetical protein
MKKNQNQSGIPHGAHWFEFGCRGRDGRSGLGLGTHDRMTLTADDVKNVHDLQE